MENLKELFKGQSSFEIIDSLKEAGLIKDDDLYSCLFDVDSETGIKETISNVFQNTYLKYKKKDSKKYEIVREHFPSFKEIYDLIDEWYSINNYELLERLDKDVMIEYLDGTYEMDSHDSEVRRIYHEEVMRDIVETIWQAKIDLGQALSDSTPDQLWELFCDAFCCGYYDKDRFDRGMEEFMEKLKSSNYCKTLK